MSDSEAYETVTVGSDGVTVTKRFEEDEFPVPAIAFEFVSDRDETVQMRLSDRVPEAVAVEDLGFHPEYGSEYWTIDEDTITFERELDAGSEYTTVYGIRATGADDVEQFLTEPAIEEVTPPLPEDETAAGTNDDSEEIVPEGDDVVRDLISAGSDVPGLEDDAEDTDDDEEIETLDLKDPTSVQESEGSDRAPGATDREIEEGIISAMAEEIRSNDVAVDDLKLLNRAFDHVAEDTDDDTADGTTDARIQKLQSDVADLRAYTDALEEFLDENGTGEQLIGEFETQLEEFGGQLDEMQSELESNSATIDRMEGTVTSAREEMDDVTDNVDEVRAEVDQVSSEVGDVATDLEEVETTVGDLDDAVDDLRSTVDELEAEVTEGDVMERIDDIESGVEDLQEWQEQIKKTFGG